MEQFLIQRDSLNRLCAAIAPGITVGLRIHAETDSRRMRHNIHAYAVVDIETPLGLMRSRGVEIRWSMRNERFYVKWPQQQFGRNRRTGQPDMLDVIGPRTPESRAHFETKILDLFHQVKAEAHEGKDFPKMENEGPIECAGPEQLEA